MYSWQYNEKMIQDWLYNHARDYGRFCCQIMYDSPLIYKEFMKGFDDELDRRTRGDDSPPSNKNGVS